MRRITCGIRCGTRYEGNEMITVFGIKNCDTVRKALKWLTANDTEHLFHDFRLDGLDDKILARWVKIVGWEKLLNTRSTSWRKLSEDQKQNISEKSAMELMLFNPTLIKRPVLENNNQLLVGFKEAEYRTL